jgi:hypothetical protein
MFSLQIFYIKVTALEGHYHSTGSNNNLFVMCLLSSKLGSELGFGHITCSMVYMRAGFLASWKLEFLVLNISKFSYIGNFSTHGIIWMCDPGMSKTLL